MTSFKMFKMFVEKQFDKLIKAFLNDWGGKFRPFIEFLKREGIQF